MAAALTQGRLRRRAAERLGPRGARLLWTPERLRAGHPLGGRRPPGAPPRPAAARGRPRLRRRRADTLAFADAGLRVVAVERDAGDRGGRPGERRGARATPTWSTCARPTSRAGPRDARAATRRTSTRPGGRRQPAVRRRGLVAAVLVGRRARGARTRHRRQGRARHPARPAPARASRASGCPGRGDLKEAALWHGPLATARRRATLLPSGATVTDAELPGASTSAPVGRLAGRAGRRRDPVRPGGRGRRPGGRAAGRRSDRVRHHRRRAGTAFGTTYQVLDEIPFALKPMRAALRARGYGDVVVRSAASPSSRRSCAAGSRSAARPDRDDVSSPGRRGPLALLVERFLS